MTSSHRKLSENPPDNDDQDSSRNDEARREVMMADEIAKFEKAMGVSWVQRPAPESVLSGLSS
jgi:hypothetical protein